MSEQVKPSGRPAPNRQRGSAAVHLQVNAEAEASRTMHTECAYKDTLPQHPPELQVVGAEGARGSGAGAPPAAHQPAPMVVQPILVGDSEQPGQR